MAKHSNPYQAPLTSDLDRGHSPPFVGWTTRRMVALFFLPWLGLIISYIGETPLVVSTGFTLCVLLALLVALFSARVDQCRQNASWPSFLIMGLVHLIAQIFSIFLAIAFFSITA